MRIIIAVLFLLLLLAQCANAEFTPAGAISGQTVRQNSVEFKLVNGLLCIYVLYDNLIRVRYTNRDKFSEAPSYAVIDNRSEAKFSFKELPDCFEIKTAELLVKVAKNPCRVSIFDKDNRLICEDEKSLGISYDGDEIRCFKKLLDKELFYGLGEKTGPLNRRGSQFVMWNSDYPHYTKEQDPLYVSIPFFIGVKEHKAYGIFLDNTWKSGFCMGAGNDRFYWFGAEKGDLDYYFIYGPEIKKVVSSYTGLTGRMELPPLWALGFQQSRWSYPSETKVRSIAKEFRDRSIPCDVIYLDIDYMDGYRVFTWNKKQFPDPEGMLASLSKQGFKIITIIDPGVKADNNYFVAKEGIAGGYFAKYPDGEVYKGEVWPSWAYFPDFTMEKTRIWWGEKLNGMLKLGVMGFWNDMNEPAVWGRNVPDIVKFNDNGYGADLRKIRNVFALQMAKATSDALHKYSDKRHFVLTRAGFSGTQRYAAVWTGDNCSNTDHLEMACLMPQSMGLSGLPFIGSDVGGYSGYPSHNLFVRWMQIGAFTPFFRAHSETGMPDKEPWTFGADVEKHSREILDFRYRLLPYLYNEFYNASRTGVPIMRPMFLQYQDDDECYREEAGKQFMLGESLLVAPVLSDKETNKKLYLPKGYWMDLWDHKKYTGNQWITVDAPISRIPLFIKEGGIVAMQDRQNYTGEKQLKDLMLEFTIVPAGHSSYLLYEDDGLSFDYRDGAYSVTKLDVDTKKDGTITIALSKPHNKFNSKRKGYCFTIFPVSAPKSVIISGKDMKNRYNDEEKLKSSREGYAYDMKRKTLHIKTECADSINMKIAAEQGSSDNEQ